MRHLIIPIAAPAVAACGTRTETVEAPPLADFHRIVAETSFITVSRWHPGVGIDVHHGFLVPCSEITCRSGDTVRASSYFSQILSETGIDNEIEIGGTRVVEGHTASPDHAEAVGVFGYHELAGGFAVKRQ